MTGYMRNWIFHTLVKNKFFKKIRIPQRRYAKEQVAAQIALNAFSKRNNETFQRSRYIDLQDFFKRYTTFSEEDEKLTKEIEETFNTIVKYFDEKLEYVNNRAFAVSIYLFVSELIELMKKEEIKEEIKEFAEFFVKFLKTLKWQIPKGVKMDPEYYDLLRFQTNITQAAGERTSIQNRHGFLKEYFDIYKKEKGVIKGDKEYKQRTKKDPNIEKGKIKLK